MDNPVVDEYGTKRWYKNGWLHREDGPAVERTDGSEEWYLNGQLHRTDGPAVMYPNGYTAWFQHGQLHRTDGPAVIHDGYNAWYKDGKLHRIDGPAVKYIDGREGEWYIGGRLCSKILINLLKKANRLSCDRNS